MNLTPAIIAAGCGATPSSAAQWLPALQTACDRFQINTPLRVAAFLAQVGHESAGLSVSRIGVIEPGMIGVMRPPETAPKRDFEGSQECCFLPDLAMTFSLLDGVRQHDVHPVFRWLCGQVIPAQRDRRFRPNVTDFRGCPESAVTMPEWPVTMLDRCRTQRDVARLRSHLVGLAVALVTA